MTWGGDLQNENQKLSELWSSTNQGFMGRVLLFLFKVRIAKKGKFPAAYILFLSLI